MCTLQRRGIVNPNYPGFQHLAHTLDYSIKASSDTDFTDDDYECEVAPPLPPTLTAKVTVADVNCLNNNNNNNEEETEYQIDQIESVNRLGKLLTVVDVLVE